MKRARWSALFFVLVAVAASACNNSSSASTTGPTPPTTPGAILSLSISSAPGSTSSVQLTATGHMGDGTTQDVTRTSTWESLNPQLATVSQTGLLTAVAKGDVDVRATYQGISGSMRVSVALPAVTSVAVTGAQPEGSFQLTATSHRADGTSDNVGAQAAWASSNPSIASISSLGFVTVVASGQVDLSATYEGVTGTVHATVLLPKQYTISGTVFQAASPSTAIANVRVQVLDGDHGYTFTDASGKFSIGNVAAGRALLEFSAPGYEVKESDIMVDSDETLSVGLDASTL